MGKARLAVLTLCLAAMAAGCLPGASAFPPRQNAVYVSRDGSLYTAIIETYDPSGAGYDREELKAMAQEEVMRYNGQYGAGADVRPVSIAECAVEEGTASIVYQYASPEDLCRFTEMSQDDANHPESLRVTTNSENLAEGQIEGDWTDARKNEPASLDAVRKREGLPMVVVSGAVTVQTEGRILYYCGAVNLKDEYTAQVEQGTACIVFR